MADDNEKCPMSLAGHFVKVRKCNYLAHSIREMEREIHDTKNIDYHIITRPSERINGSSSIFFHSSGCTVFLPAECENMDDREVRLLLAHELGHIIYNIDKLETLKGVKSPSKTEELFAWKFSFHLIKGKSDAYKRGEIDTQRYAHDFKPLKVFLSKIVKNKQQNIYDDIVQFLRNQKE